MLIGVFLIMIVVDWCFFLNNDCCGLFFMIDIKVFADSRGCYWFGM